MNKEVTINDFKSNVIDITIKNKVYTIRFIPYDIESDIYANMNFIGEILNNIFNVKKEDLEKISNWIWGVLSHKENNTEITKDVFDLLGVTERIQIMVVLVGFITKRITMMSGMLQTDQKKNQETKENS
jgi:uncharacterized membrane protein YkgB